MRKTILLLFIGVFILSCSSANMRRLNYIVNNPQTDPQTAYFIRSGMIAEGMSTAEVQASWGDPLISRSYVNSEARSDKWVYKRGGKTFILYFKNGKLTSRDVF